MEAILVSMEMHLDILGSYVVASQAESYFSGRKVCRIFKGSA